MAVEMPVFTKTFKAGGSISQYYAVKLSADNTVVVCSGVTDKPIGVAQEAASANGMVTVMIIGETKINTDAGLSVGALIGTAADGQLAAYVAGTDTTKYCMGQVTKATGNAGEIGSAIINCANIGRMA